MRYQRVGDGSKVLVPAVIPKGAVHPVALALLRELGYDTSALRSKSWDDFAGGPRFDFRVHGVRPSSGGAMPGMAKPTNHRTLEHCRSRRS
jgi:hypothetical protein